MAQKQKKSIQEPADDEAALEREWNEVDGVEQPPSGLRPSLGRDDGDSTAGGTGKSL